jgi:hypothetical protein
LGFSIPCWGIVQGSIPRTKEEKNVSPLKASAPFWSHFNGGIKKFEAILILHAFCFWFLVMETRSHYVSQTVFVFEIFLPQLPECLDYRHVLLLLSSCFSKTDLSFPFIYSFFGSIGV